MDNRELTYYSLLSRALLRHIEELADTTPQETFIALGFEKKHFHHLWIGPNNGAFISTVSFIIDLDKLNMTLQGQLKSYVRKNGYGFEEDKGDFYKTYLARKNWLKHTIFIFNNEYNKTKNEIFIEVVKWCKDWENEWLETFNPYSPKELEDMETDFKKPLWLSLENNEKKKAQKVNPKLNDFTNVKHLKCTSQEFITDISKLCNKCPLPSLINDGMKDQIVAQAQEQKEILTGDQFKNYLSDEVKSAQQAMQRAFLKEGQEKENKNDKFRANRIQNYIWNKERIKALNRFIEPLKKSNKIIPKKSNNTKHNSDTLKVIPVKTEKSIIQQKVENAFSFMLDRDLQKHEFILNENDYENLINWVTSFFENELTIPKIDTPIKKINTAKGNVFYTFKLLYDEIKPTGKRSEKLFLLIQKCFYEYREYKVSNMKKSKNPQYYAQLLKKNK